MASIPASSARARSYGSGPGTAEGVRSLAIARRAARMSAAAAAADPSAIAMISPVLGPGIRACGLMSRSSESRSTETTSKETGAATAAVREPVGEVTAIRSAGVRSSPSSKTWASNAMVVVSVPSPLSTVEAPAGPLTSSGPHVSASSSGPTPWPAGWRTEAETRTTSPITRRSAESETSAVTGPCAKAVETAMSPAAAAASASAPRPISPPAPRPGTFAARAPPCGPGPRRNASAPGRSPSRSL